MPFVCRDTGLPIQGTSETLSASYPVTRDESGGWTYSGGPSKLFDEGAEPDTDPETGEVLRLARRRPDRPLVRPRMGGRRERLRAPVPPQSPPDPAAEAKAARCSGRGAA